MQLIPLRYIYGINLNAEYDQSVTGAAYSVNNLFLQCIFMERISLAEYGQSMADAGVLMKLIPLRYFYRINRI